MNTQIDKRSPIQIQIAELPNEILFNILSKLPSRDLVNARKVCSLWRDVVDRLCANQKLWRRHCEKDYSEVFSYARFRADKNMTNYELYKSLSMWKFVRGATEDICEFRSKDPFNPILGSSLLDNDILCVHREYNLEYCDLNDGLKNNEDSDISGAFISSTENERALVLMEVVDNILYLYVIRKNVPNEYDKVTVFEGVANEYLLTADCLYVVKNRDVHKVSLTGKQFMSNKVNKKPIAVARLALSMNTLIVHTPDHETFKLNEGTLVKESPDNNKIHNYHNMVLQRLIGRLPWYQSNIILLGLLSGLTKDVAITFKYGNIWIYGTTWGTVFIFPAPAPGVIHPPRYNPPIKQYKLTNTEPIIALDVKETKNGPHIIVTCPTTIFKITCKLNSVKNLQRSCWRVCYICKTCT